MLEFSSNRSPWKEVLKELRQAHPGMDCMKNIARSLVWWPMRIFSIQSIYARIVKKFGVKLQTFLFTLANFQRRFGIHMSTILVHSMALCGLLRWTFEVIGLSTSWTTVTVTALKSVNARLVVPKQSFADDVPDFTSEEFLRLGYRLQIQHVCTTPYPRSNGDAERFERRFKECFLPKKVSWGIIIY